MNSKNELIADIYESLENVKKWKPIYLTLLKTCPNKEEALKALKYLIALEDDMERPKINDQFINEEGRIFEIVEILPNYEYRCKRSSQFSSHAMEYVRFNFSEILHEKQGNFWILTIDACENRFKKGA